MKLQTSPLGLLGILGLKTQGQAPTQFSETVQPSIEVTDYYGAPTLAVQRKNQISAGGLTTDTQSVVVPNDAVWRIFSVGSAVNLNAADLAKSVNFAIYIDQPDGVGMPIFMGSGGGFASVADRVAPIIVPVLLLPSGWKVRSVVTFSAALAANASYDLWVLRQEFDA